MSCIRNIYLTELSAPNELCVMEIIQRKYENILLLQLLVNGKC